MWDTMVCISCKDEEILLKKEEEPVTKRMYASHKMSQPPLDDIPLYHKEVKILLYIHTKHSHNQA